MSQLPTSLEKNNKVVTLRWIARASSLLSLGFLLFIFVGEGIGFSAITRVEWLMLLCFPVGVALGMIVGWWKELFGGGITAVSILLFYLIDLLSTGELPRGFWFLIFTLPGFLFLLHGLLDRKS